MIPSQRFDIYVASCVPAGGIFHYRLIEGHLELAEMISLDRPMYMVADKRKMYVVLRTPFENEESGVVIYDLDDTGRLINPSDIQSTKGEVACHIMVNEGSIYCANYISGSFIRLPDGLVQHTGHGADPDRQAAPHVHFVGLTPDKRYLCITDLGLDTIFLYDMDLRLHTQIVVPMGHGVRHLDFSEDGKWLFAVNELQSTVSVFAYEEGKLEAVDICKTVPVDFMKTTTAAAIRVKDECIYVSNRGHDSIAKLSFNHGKLALEETFDCGGRTPRDFCFAGEYLLCANQDSDCVTVLDGMNEYRVCNRTEIVSPVCVCAVKGLQV